MNQQDFPDYPTFASEVRAGRLKPLDAKNVLARVYLVRQMDDIIGSLPKEDYQKVLAELSKPWEGDTPMGRSATLAKAEILRAALSDDRLELAILNADARMTFANLTYKKLAGDTDFEAYRKWLCEKVGKPDTISPNLNWPLRVPPGRQPRLDSIRFNPKKKQAMLVFSVTRVLSAPSSEIAFVARIPVRATVMFDERLVELASPNFAEHNFVDFATHDEVDGLPQRSVYLHGCTFAKLVSDYLPNGSTLSAVQGPRIFDCLEQRFGGDDLGWSIERDNGGELNTKQRRLALKKILNDFQTELARKYASLGIENPLQNISLYRLFRMIKAESHASSMVLSIPLGKRQGKVELTGFFGTPDQPHDALLHVLSHGYGKIALDRLRTAVKVSQDPNTELVDMYSIEAAQAAQAAAAARNEARIA